MKQTFKKKPEYLDAIYVEDDTQSIKDVYEFTGVLSGNITFNDEGNRIITIVKSDKEIDIPVGDVVFKDKKGEIVHMKKEHLLKFYDEYYIEKQMIVENYGDESE